MVGPEESCLLKRLGRRVIDGHHEATHALIDRADGGDRRRRPSREKSVLPFARQARERRCHSGEEQRGYPTSENGERELEVAYALGWGVREPRLDPRDDVDGGRGTVVRVRYDAPCDGVEDRAVGDAEHPPSYVRTESGLPRSKGSEQLF
jgi:hypothetical protein